MQKTGLSCHEAYPHYDLGKFKSFITMQMEALCFSITSVLTTATWYKVPGDIFQYKACLQGQHIYSLYLPYV
jgi:hypothetical protein